MPRRFDSISLDDLIEALNEARDEHGGDIKVLFGSDYGDRGHTTQAHDFVGEYEVVEVEESGYSHSGFAIVEEENMVMDSSEEPAYLRIK